MNTNKLRHMLNSINCQQNVIVIPADGLSVYSEKNMPPVGYSAICNTHPSTRMGEHWICLQVLGKDKLLIFDSLSSGQHLHNEYIRKFRNLFPHLERNDGLLQDPFSSSCGLFCIYFFHYKCNQNMSLKMLIDKKFTDNVILNECQVLQFISKRYDKKLYSNFISTCPL